MLSQYWSSSSGRFRDTRPERWKKIIFYMWLQVIPLTGNCLSRIDSEKETKEILSLEGSFVEKRYPLVKKKNVKVLKLADVSVMNQPATDQSLGLLIAPG